MGQFDPLFHILYGLINTVLARHDADWIVSDSFFSIDIDNHHAPSFSSR